MKLEGGVKTPKIIAGRSIKFWPELLRRKFPTLGPGDARGKIGNYSTATHILLFVFLFFLSDARFQEGDDGGGGEAYL